MGLFDRWIVKRSKKPEMGSAIINNYASVSDDDILSSSDVYKFMKDISDMIALSTFSITDNDDNVIKDPQTLRQLRRPNMYLTEFEFKKLLANTYLLQGEVFIANDDHKLHIVKNVHSELTDQGIKKYSVSGTDIPPYMIAHIKNIGTSHLEGVGIIDLAKDMIEGVMNAEKSITDKYKKGGLLAFLLKLDAHLSPNNKLQTAMVDNILTSLSEIPDEGKTVLIPLSKGYSIEALQSFVDDEKLLKYLSVYKPDLGKYFGFDPDAYLALLKVDLEKAALYLFNWIVEPIVRNIEEHLSLLMFPTNANKRVKMTVNMMKYLTMSAKISNVSNLVRSMTFSPDDGRETMGLPRLNTDVSTQLYVSKDLIGLNDLADVTEAEKGGDETG
ncbi:phage portal protein [Listeria booriae]|uniref:phage portal protein n=1 Tax=Listeria booriae TaxID=1552123 RepID=UPI0021ADF85C|nr:phage portal protein [Listeria booriae]